MYTYNVPLGDCGGGGGGTQSATSGGGYLATGLSPFGGGGTTSSVIDPGEDPGLPPPPPPQSDTCIYDSIFQTTYYVYSGGELVNQYYSTDSTGSKDGSYLALFYGPAGLMKTIYHPVTGSDDIRFQHLDYKGSLRSQSDENGLPVGGQNIYYPYGEILQLGSSPTHRRYFQTGESDHTGFVHMGARYYDPTIGRFITPDPIDASVSAYTFASGNPIMFFDPSGLVSTQPGATRPKFVLATDRDERWTQLLGLLGLIRDRTPVGIVVTGAMKRNNAAYQAVEAAKAIYHALWLKYGQTNFFEEESGGHGMALGGVGNNHDIWAETKAANAAITSSASDKAGNEDATNDATKTNKQEGTSEEDGSFVGPPAPAAITVGSQVIDSQPEIEPTGPLDPNKKEIEETEGPSEGRKEELRNQADGLIEFGKAVGDVGEGLELAGELALLSPVTVPASVPLLLAGETMSYYGLGTFIVGTGMHMLNDTREIDIIDIIDFGRDVIIGLSPPGVGFAYNQATAMATNRHRVQFQAGRPDLFR